jgi:hypothetical protein
MGTRRNDHVVYIAEFSPSEGLFRGERRDGGQGTTYIWLEAEAELAGPTSVRLGEPLTFAFTLPLPRFWLPSMRTADGSVTWKLGTVLRRAGKPDVRAFHEVVVHTWEALPAHGQDVLPSGGGVRVRRVDASAG